ncbi:hypothetical protein GH714_019697 [Hevea brasiliensis]|uniref:BED-type domain-containing protein n=1 Tax=Hevea brasiliensis TaxID=3981 RepID=A0A6A6LC83_HEVBR|nr:hypothetical protein GH714_019697 [Hevea brasiliensis]
MDSCSSEQNDPINTIDSNQSEQETAISSKSKVKRKPVRPRSKVWDHFTKFKTNDGDTKGMCNYCDKEFCCDPKRNVATALRNHMNVCKKHPHAIETRQALLNLQPNSNNVEDEVGTLTTWKYDENAIREALVHMIIIDELIFKFVEVLKVRNAVRYIKSSPAKLKKFKECLEYEKIDGKSSLCLDVSTRWNLTYLILNKAQNYERTFERKMAEMLSHFYELILRISGSLYVTSNMFFGEISDLAFILSQRMGNTDIEVKNMGDRMKKKFDKYWEDMDKMNKLIYFAVILDPRDKFEYMEFQFCQMHGEEKGEQLLQKMKSSLIDLFNEYKKMYQTDCEQTSDNTNSQLPSGSVVVVQ